MQTLGLHPTTTESQALQVMLRQAGCPGDLILNPKASHTHFSHQNTSWVQILSNLLFKTSLRMPSRNLKYICLKPNSRFPFKDVFLCLLYRTIIYQFLRPNSFCHYSRYVHIQAAINTPRGYCRSLRCLCSHLPLQYTVHLAATVSLLKPKQDYAIPCLPNLPEGSHHA